MTRPRLVRDRVHAALRPLLGGGQSDVSASPAMYETWLAREPWLSDRHPEAWAGRPDLPLESDAHIVAVVHVYYPKLLDEIIDRLASVPVPFDLIVTNSSSEGLVIDPDRLPLLQQTVVLDVENRGRDLWPLVQLVNAGLLDRYGLIVKVHTKRSLWRDAHAKLSGSGASWRSHLLKGTLGDTEEVTGLLAAFEEEPDLGMVTADGSVLGPQFWGRNRPLTVSLLRRLDFEMPPPELTFAAGSMYWIRASILRGLRDLRMSRADFEDEQGQVDGTTAHALERVIGLLLTGAGLRIVERSRLDSRG